MTETAICPAPFKCHYKLQSKIFKNTKTLTCKKSSEFEIKKLDILYTVPLWLSFWPHSMALLSLYMFLISLLEYLASVLTLLATV